MLPEAVTSAVAESYRAALNNGRPINFVDKDAAAKRTEEMRKTFGPEVKLIQAHNCEKCVHPFHFELKDALVCSCCGGVSPRTKGEKVSESVAASTD